jgi:predicted RNA-binding protein
MAYYLDLFSPETYEAFSKSNRGISGFRPRQQGAADRVKPGDKLVCYMTKLSRWIGVLEVLSESFHDNTPIFYPTDDPFVIRFKVKPIAWLPKEKAIPVHEDKVWNHLSFTKNMDKDYSYWTGKFRSSLNLLVESDGVLLEQLLVQQVTSAETYPIDPEEYEKLLTHRVHRADKVISVTVPKASDDRPGVSATPHTEVRDSIRIQAMLARIGAEMGMKIWIPRNDRTAVFTEWKSDNKPVLDNLPLNYDETTIKTIEQIDILWLRGRAIVRAFEVEHTTSIYSGILRMADLLALQPNMNIKLHIVAPAERRDKVFQELRRPVFSLLDEAPLSERCTYLSYDSVEELVKQKHLAHLSDSVLDEYAEEAE